MPHPPWLWLLNGAAVNTLGSKNIQDSGAHDVDDGDHRLVWYHMAPPRHANPDYGEKPSPNNDLDDQSDELKRYQPEL